MRSSGSAMDNMVFDVDAGAEGEYWCENENKSCSDARFCFDLYQPRLRSEGEYAQSFRRQYHNSYDARTEATLRPATQAV